MITEMFEFALAELMMMMMIIIINLR